VEIHLFKPKPDKKMSLTRIQPEKKREKTSAGSKSNMFASKTFPASSNPKNALVSLSPSPSPRVQSQTEGEPTAQPPRKQCVSQQALASRVISLHQAAGKFEISATIQC
jgi:hypothetical protein